VVNARHLHVARSLPAVVLLAALLAGGPAMAEAPAPGGVAPDRSRYLVVLDDEGPRQHDHGTPRRVDELLAGVGAEARPDTLRHVYSAALDGFAASLTPAQAARLAASGGVASVEPDQRVVPAAQVTPSGVDRVADPDVASQAIATLAIDGADDERVDADIAIVDSGIAAHPDLNVVGRVDCVTSGGASGRCTDGTGDDLSGHGTHLAGTAAAIDDAEGVVGVAPGARLWSVRVLEGLQGGFVSDVLAAIDWVTARADTIEVANFSFGCFDCRTSAMDSAITEAVDAGVVIVASAGNEATSASRVWPANHPDVITVSAVADLDGVSGAIAADSCGDQDDTLADFSNDGPAVDVAAPGTCVVSTAVGGGYVVLSGTSMSTAHVSGAAALLAAKEKPKGRAGVLALRAAVVATGSDAWLDDGGTVDPDGVKEPLLDVSVADYQVGLPASATVVCPDGGVPSAGFTDVGPNDVHRPSVDCAAALGITRGRTATLYRPDLDVTRGQMASFVVSTIEGAGVELAASRDHFGDDDGDIHEASINQLAEAGVVNGTGPGSYAPGARVTRDQMATFLVSAHDLVVERALRSPNDYFSDDDDNVHEASIDKAAEAGLALGVGSTRFGPRDPVRRNQMASFVVRLAQQLATGSR
jgi:hypothetical protein